MNNILIKILCFIFLFLFNTCSDENPVSSNTNQYYGSWVWLKTVGGFAPRVIVPAPGTELKISFDYFNNYKLYLNDTLKVSANYKIEVVENGWDKLSYSNIVTYNYNFSGYNEFIEKHSDTLQAWDGMIDGYFSFYKKVQ